MTILEESIKNHQALVDVINSNRNKQGICKLSQVELAQRLNKCPSWVSQAIQRLNRETICIVKTKEGYFTNYNDITVQGTFFKIIQAICYFSKYPEKFNLDEKKIAESLHIKRQTLQAAKAYLRNSF